MFSRTVSQGNSVYDWNTIPRSAPGAVTGEPSSTTRPVVGVSRPATMRSSVDLPQPDGPRIVMKSLSSTASVVGCSATVGAPPRTPGNVGRRLDRELAHCRTCVRGVHRAGRALLALTPGSTDRGAGSPT